MKKCPQCGRDYNDDSMSFCLDDGSELLFGPARSEPGAVASGFRSVDDEPQTVILSEPPASAGGQFAEENPTQRFAHTTAAEAELREILGGSSEKHSFSANRAAKPLIGAAVAVAILMGGFFGYRYFKSSSGSQINSIAVLPFENRSGNADSDYLSDGLAESLIYRLTQLPNLKVSPTSSVIRYRGKDADIAQVAKELEVDAVMSGRLVQRGENLTVSVELIDTRTKKLLWGEQYDRKMSDLLATQREIAAKITETLRLKMSGRDEQIAEKQYTSSNEAYQLYLKGRYHWGKRAAPELRLAMENFKHAIAADPNFALAYAGLADCYSLLPIYDNGGARAVHLMPLAKEAVVRAISIDDSLAEAHASLALIDDIFEWDTTSAEREYKRAIELKPTYATAHQWYGEMLSNLGRFEEGLAESRRAVELEPFSPAPNFAFGLNLFKARRYDDAIVQLNRLLEQNPGFADANHFLFQTYAAKGDYERAVQAFITQQSLDGKPAADSQKLKDAFAIKGWDGFLKQQINAIETTQGGGENRNGMAKVYAMAGDRDKAIKNLELSVRDKDEGMTWLLVDPLYDDLRPDPRFQDLVKRVGFAD